LPDKAAPLFNLSALSDSELSFRRGVACPDPVDIDLDPSLSTKMVILWTGLSWRMKTSKKM